MNNNGAMLYEDYILIRDAKVGDHIVLSDGTEMDITKKDGNIGSPWNKNKTTKNMGLSFYDRTYEG